MAELDLDALEQAAREAGGGCWFSTGWTVGSRGFEVGDLKSRDRICSDAAERCAEFIAAANPATILELLDRLKAAESDAAHQKALADSALRVAEGWEEKCNSLRAKIEQMERQEPVAWTTKLALEYGASRLGFQVSGVNMWGENGVPLYALPGAQNAPVEQDESVRKSWARFSHELHRSPDAPYPGMSDAFERHFSQSFIDREWRAEASTWAAAWKAAKSHCAQPAPSICPAALSPIINWLRNGCDPRKAADELEMLAAAPETKP